MSAASGSDASRSAIRLTATPQIDGYQGCEEDQRRQCGKAQHANRCRCSPAVELWTEGESGRPDDSRVDPEEPNDPRDRTHHG
jgi:hypothetical protein